MASQKALGHVQEKIVGEIAEVLELTDPQKTTRNAAVLGLAVGAATAAVRAQAGGGGGGARPALHRLRDRRNRPQAGGRLLRDDLRRALPDFLCRHVPLQDAA